MRFPSFTYPLTGVAVPIGALRTGQSCGIGEFLDLIPFADFCSKAGIDLIQLLPVNDTGTESSPYSALSAFALHPAYISLRALPEAEPFRKDIDELAAKHEPATRFSYREVRDAKLELLHRIYDVHENNIVDSPTLAAWIGQNPWIVPYAVFMNLKRRNFEASWKSWDKLRTPTHAEILERWEAPGRKAEHWFYAWVQMRLEQQFLDAVAHCQAKGIALKGDIPILMNEDSCDAWANPEFFRDDLRAGSPPDGMNPLGQNWGFPIYNWDNLADDEFGWWKDRLARASRFFNAYRIDHILGFFRIWSIPSAECSGYLGWPTPHTPITAAELAALGYTGDRLRWVTEPHVPTNRVEAVNNHDYLGAHGAMRAVMNRIGEEELWVFKPEIRGESDIRNAPALSAEVRETLAAAWRDRLFQVTGRDEAGKPLYAPIWNYRDSSAWKSLSDRERESLESLFRAKRVADEALWRDQARSLLGTLTRSTDMLPCAEDLGSVPDSVPEVLEELGILGLKVVRWERVWEERGQPYRRIVDYIERSVATPSVHDSSTLRGWWDGEGAATDFLAANPPESRGYPPGTTERFRQAYTPEVAAYVLDILADTGSRLLVPPLQDFLGLSGDFYGANAEEDRVNVPGSVTAFNWTWRLPVPVEKLEKNKHLIGAIAAITKKRRARQAAKGSTK